MRYADYKEEQAMEVEALEAIYMEDFARTCPRNGRKGGHLMLIGWE